MSTFLFILLFIYVWGVFAFIPEYDEPTTLFVRFINQLSWPIPALKALFRAIFIDKW